MNILRYSIDFRWLQDNDDDQIEERGSPIEELILVDLLHGIFITWNIYYGVKFQ